MPNTNPIKPENADVVRKIRLLRAHTKQTGMITTRSEGTLLSRLAPDDLVEVLEALEQDASSQRIPSDRFTKSTDLSHGVKRFDANGIPEKNYNQ